MELPKEILRIENFLTKKECKKIQNMWDDSIIMMTQLYDEWTGRVKRLNFTGEIERKIKKESIQKVSQYFGKPLKAIDLSTTIWREGESMPAHTDDGAHKEFMNRHYAVVIYINDDYKGGEIYFPDLNNLQIKPKMGDLIAFPGDRLLHGVKPSYDNNRLTVIFWAEDLSRNINKNKKN